MRLIDTDICSYLIRRNPDVIRRVTNLDPGKWAISVITQYELQYGILKNQPNQSLHDSVTAFLSLANIVDFDAAASSAAATIRANLSSRGQVIGNFDPLIAGHAIALNATLVTNNTKHFERIDGLKLESWVA